jgi:hypothetical protein
MKAISLLVAGARSADVRGRGTTAPVTGAHRHCRSWRHLALPRRPPVVNVSSVVTVWP